MRLASLPSRAGKTIVILLCLAHMAAVGVYSIPADAHDPLAELGRRVISPQVAPYILTTSQWQQWNMFSPEPLHRFGEYRIQTLKNNQWVTIRTLTSENIPWWRHGGELKLIRLLEEPNTEALRVRYLQQLCRPLGLNADDVIRLELHVAYVPLAPPEGGWSAWTPEWVDTPTGGVACAIAYTEHLIDIRNP
jgi:hypothetical protein